MTRTRQRSKGTFLVRVAVTVAGAGLLAVAGGAAANHDSPGNYTVHLPEQGDHRPGNGPSASIWHLAAMADAFDGTSSPKGFETADTLVIGSDAIDFSSCRTENTGAFGVDRGDDDPGTNTDDPLLAHREESQFNANSIVVEFYGEDAAFGQPVSIDAEDQIVAVQNDCYDMPDEPGWYQIFGSLNGTGYDGTHFEISLDSHYFYVCDCASEEEARRTLGPPPSQRGGDSDGTATPEATATPGRGGSSATATPASGGEEPTDTTTATPTRQSGGDGPTEGGQQDDDSRQTDGGRSDAGQQEQQRTTGDEAAGAGGVTPTVADGPGFGAGLALVALVGATLVALRRD